MIARSISIVKDIDKIYQGGGHRGAADDVVVTVAGVRDDVPNDRCKSTAAIDDAIDLHGIDTWKIEQID